MVKDGEAQGKFDSREIFRSLYLHMVEGVALHELVCDGEGNPTNYRILDVNPQFDGYVGISGSEAIGKLATEAYGTTEAPYLAEFSRATLSGTPTRFETHFAPFDRFYDISVVPFGTRQFATIFLDISERRRSERALRESEWYLQRAQHIAHIGSYRFDIAKGTWRSSESLDVLFGIENGFQRDLAGWLSLVHHEEREEMHRYLVEDVVRAGHDFDRRYRIVRANDGSVRWVHGMGELERDASGQPIVMVGIIQDITEQRNLEQQMLHSQKLESLGVLAGGIAHDFNNLLTGILGNADLAKTEMSPLAPSRTSLEGIEVAARRAADLCRQLLAYSGRGRFTIEPLNLQELVEELGHLLTISISKKVVLKYHFSQGIPAVEADATQVRQVIMNLIVNASEAIGQRSGVISVTVGLAHCEGDYLKGCFGADRLQPGDFVYLEVADTGHGMDKSTMDRIFDPFYSTKFTGRGLGLAAVLGIMRGHQGAIRVYSEPGRGTTFKLLFPASENLANKLQPKTSISAGYHASGKILLADDEETIRNLGRRMLQRAGFEVIVAADGREAIEKFASDKDGVALVILDLTMPHADGEACYREMRRLKPSVKVILSSGYNEQDVVNRFAGKGLAGFIQKPYTTEEFLAKIREALAKP